MVSPGYFIWGIFILDIILMIYVTLARKKYAEKLAAYNQSKKKTAWSYMPYVIWIIMLFASYPLLGKAFKGIAFLFGLAAIFGVLTIGLVVGVIEIQKIKKS